MADFRLAVTHLTFEGIQIFGGGVATVTRGHLRSLPRVRAALSRHGIDLSAFFAEVAYTPEHRRWSPDNLEYARGLIADMDGELGFLPNYTQGGEPWGSWGVPELGGVENWKVESASGASFLLNVARDHDATVGYCHDSVFALAPLYASLQAEAYNRARLAAIYVVHATALTHEMPLPNPERLMVESVAMHWPKVNESAKLGRISEFMIEHLVRDYGADASTIVPTGNGVDPADPTFQLRDPATIEAKLAEHGVPTDRDLIFCWGRSVAYKKYDMVLKTAARFKDALHPVLILSPEYPEMVELAKELGLSATIITAFDSELVACMLQHERTKVACALAYREPCGLTPSEIRLHARKSGPVVVVSDTGGLPEQVESGVDGFITRQDDVDDVAAAVDKVLGMSEGKLNKVRAAGAETILSRYTWSTQILTTLAATVPEVAAAEEAVRAELVSDQRACVGD